MLTPSDPTAFRADVLRRAVRLERRRRRGRLLVGAAAVLALALSATSVLTVRRAEQPAVEVSTAATTRNADLHVRVLALPELARPHSLVSDGRSTWVLDRGDGDGPTLARYVDGRLALRAELPDDAAPEHLVAGTDGAVWMTDPAGARVLRVTPDGEVARLPVRATPSASSVFASERLWFGDVAAGRLTLVDAEGHLVHRQLPTGAAPEIVAFGPDGSVWYGDARRAGIGSVSPSGAVATYDLGRPDERVLTMAPGPGSALWFLIRSGDGLRTGRVDGAGRIVEDDVEPSSAARGVTPGPDGRLWFTSGAGTALLRRSVGGLAATPLDEPLRASSLALTSEGTVWAVDRDRARIVELAVP